MLCKSVIGFIPSVSRSGAAAALTPYFSFITPDVKTKFGHLQSNKHHFLPFTMLNMRNSSWFYEEGCDTPMSEIPECLAPNEILEMKMKSRTAAGQ